MYQGDEALAGLLAKHGGKPLDETRALVAGIAAAAVAADDADWPRLVAENPSPALVAQLEALRRESADARPALTPGERLANVRAELKRLGIDGLLVPRADEFLGEYVPPRGERLAWLTGFTGSAGMAIVTADRAALFVDGRYTLQGRTQAPEWEQQHLTEQPPTDWLAAHAKPGQRFGVDPWVFTVDQLDRLRRVLANAGAELVELDASPLDQAWADQPPAPLGPVRPHPIEASGLASDAKRATAVAEMGRLKAEAAVIADPSSIAWLLNIRGSDVPHTPLPLSYAILDQDSSVRLFLDPAKLLPETREHLGNRVAIAPISALAAALDGLAGKPVLVDAAGVAAAIVRRLERAGAKLVAGADPCLLPKACKNAVELEGTRTAHHRDAVAVIRFLAWIDGHAQDGTVGEIAASDRLEAFRRETGALRDLSFSTISGAGANGAIVHYRASPESERKLTPGELYLVDSGAQYVDGTTDITRTVPIGTPDAEQRDRFTRVLQGHIALSRAVFPAGTTGSQLDAFARRPLWEAGLDYDHGTGHGVGSYLSVHEGPQRISKVPNTVALRPGMIVSNEPGYYKTGAYGIRIENLVAVRTVEIPGAERPMLGFETLTLAPIDRRLIEVSLLSPAERAWIDTYHAWVMSEIGPRLDPATRAWLQAATQPL